MHDSRDQFFRGINIQTKDIIERKGLEKINYVVDFSYFENEIHNLC